MKIIKMLLVPALLLFACNLLASDDEGVFPEASKQWKIDFFKEYMDEYRALERHDHGSISTVLQNSFAKTTGKIPEQDKELAAGVSDQVAFFVNLTDPVTIEREVKKCTEGMKQANGFFAKFAPNAAKARMFVDRFYKEYKNRQSKIDTSDDED